MFDTSWVGFAITCGYQLGSHASTVASMLGCWPGDMTWSCAHCCNSAKWENNKIDLFSQVNPGSNGYQEQCAWKVKMAGLIFATLATECSVIANLPTECSVIANTTSSIYLRYGQGLNVSWQSVSGFFTADSRKPWSMSQFYTGQSQKNDFRTCNIAETSLYQQTSTNKWLKQIRKA